MTTSIRPADWIALLREEAQQKGRPILGLSSPSVLPVDYGGMVGYVHKRGSKFVVTSLLASGRSQRLDGESALTVLQGANYSSAQPGALVFPDAATAIEAKAHLSAERSEAGRAAARAIDLGMALASSRHVVVLPAALDRKFFAPSDTAVASFDGWRKAFELEGISAIDAARELYRKVITGPGGLAEDAEGLVVDEPAPPTLRSAARAEAKMIESLQYTGVASECSRFGTATLVSGVWSFVQDSDPLRRDLSYLDGTVFPARIITVTDSHVYARITPPFKARIDKEVLVLPDDAPGDNRNNQRLILEEIKANPAGDFVAHLRMVERSPHRVSAGDTVDMMQAPFLAPPLRTTKTKWTSPPALDEQGQRRFREVPLSVSLAGAPQEGR